MNNEQSPEEQFARAWVPFFEFPFDAERMEINVEDYNFRAQATQAINALPSLLKTIDALRDGAASNASDDPANALQRILIEAATEAHPSIDDTIAYAVSLHEGQRDKQDIPYIAHLLSVMRRVPEGMWHVAVLHDAKEDCGVTDDDLRDEGYTEEEIAAIDLLTRRPHDSYHEFIERIATSDNLTAITVKLADIDDNLDPTRGWKIPAGVVSRYLDARTRLRMVKEGR